MYNVNQDIQPRIKNELIILFTNILSKYEHNINVDNILYLESITNNYQSNVFELIKLSNINLSLTEKQALELSDITAVLNAFYNNRTISIPQALIDEINNNSTIKYIIYYLKRVIETSKNTTNHVEKLNDILQLLQNLKETDYFTEFDKIENFMRNFKDVDLITKSRINTLIGEYNILTGIKREKINLTEEDIIKEVEKNNIAYDELDNLFKKYNYDLSEVSDDIVEKLLLLGHINNIDYIFNWYNSLDIRFDLKKDEKYLHLLYRSNREIIEEMTEFSKKANINIKSVLNKSFSSFMSKSENTQIRSRRKESNIKRSNTYNDLIGSHEDLIKNTELFEQLGYDIPSSYQKSATVFTFPHKIIRNNIKALKQYGIDVEKERDNIKLTGLKNYEILYTIDKFIELDELDYLLNNTSRLSLPPDDVIFYRLYQAKKDNVPYKSTSYKNSYKQFITVNSKEQKITNTNKKEVTNTERHIIFDEEIDQELKRKISSSDFNIDMSRINNELIKKLDDNYLSDDKMAYNLGKNRISRLKVLRLLTILSDIKDSVSEEKLLLYVTSYNSILSPDEFELLKQDVSRIVKEKGLSL